MHIVYCVNKSARLRAHKCIGEDVAIEMSVRKKKRDPTVRYSAGDILNDVNIISLVRRRKGRRIRSRIDASKRLPIKKPQRDGGSIPETITDPITAIYDTQRRKSVDFDEAMATMEKEEKIDEDEKIAYIGAGEFAVIDKEKHRRNMIEVKRKIAFEDKKNVVPWREQLCYDIDDSEQKKNHTIDTQKNERTKS